MKNWMIKTGCVAGTALIVFAVVARFQLAEASEDWRWTPVHEQGTEFWSSEIENEEVQVLSVGCLLYDDPAILTGITIKTVSSLGAKGTEAKVYTNMGYRTPSAFMGGRWTFREGGGVQLVFEDDTALIDALRMMGYAKKVQFTIHQQYNNKSVFAEFNTADIFAAGMDALSKCRTANGNRARQPSSSYQSTQDNDYGDTPLHTAIRNGDINSARRIIATSPKTVLCRQNNLDQTPAALADILDSDAWSMLYSAGATDNKCRR